MATSRTVEELPSILSRQQASGAAARSQEEEAMWEQIERIDPAEERPSGLWLEWASPAEVTDSS